ncbi:MAG: RNA-directed DNA polymerase [bacterium]|nr:RNA-directed DNA polymerase [bacterium]
MGYSKEVSRGLALLCTHRPMLSPVYWIGGLAPTALWRAGRHAVAGAPTSPALANLCVYRLDNRLTGLAKKFEAVYTRYADDLTFSGPAAFKRGMKRFLPLVLRIIRDEGFRQNRRKLRFMRPGHRQEVTGLVVNQKVNTRRADYDRIKAIIHNARKAGSLESQNRAGHPAFRAHLLGRIASVRHVNPERGQRLLAALDDVP